MKCAHNIHVPVRERDSERVCVCGYVHVCRVCVVCVVCARARSVSIVHLLLKMSTSSCEEGRMSNEHI